MPKFKPIVLVNGIESKLCTGPCQQIKPLTEFAKCNNPIPYMSKCKKCQNNHARENGKNQRTKKRNNRRSYLQKRIHFTEKVICIRHYSNNTMKCNCCGEHRIRLLTIDHINCDGATIREELNIKSGHHYYKYLIDTCFPPGHQVLCANCNLDSFWHNTCIHEEERQLAIKLKEREDNEKYSLPLFPNF